jgi:hypothetical protein
MAVWGVRDETPRERRENTQLQQDLLESPVRGKPLPPRPRNFAPSAESYIRSLNGPLPYMVRLRAIDEQTERHERELERAWRELAAVCDADAARFERRWRELAERRSFAAVNALIEEHNRWYPMEASLPMDPRRRDFALVNGRSYRRELLGPDWVLGRFPPVLARAAA